VTLKDSLPTAFLVQQVRGLGGQLHLEPVNVDLDDTSMDGHPTLQDNDNNNNS